MDTPSTDDESTSDKQIEKNKDGEGLETIGNEIVCILLLKSKKNTLNQQSKYNILVSFSKWKIWLGIPILWRT